MKLETNTLNEKVIQSTGHAKSMKLDDGSQAMIFKMFTGGLYSDPVGTIIREIASNCFDSHIEAGKNNTSNPVVIKLSKEVSGNFITFIDKGVGMSPDRVENIYGTYFKSTKRDTNDQIGGFGLGGKTPLAYTSSFFITTVSEKENDIEFNTQQLNDLFEEIKDVDIDSEEYISLNKEIQELENRLLTISNFKGDKVEYVYNIFESNDAPAFEELSYKSSNAVNGTEVKIPIKENDVREFERKTLRQLYYFDNIVFEGFSDDFVTNDYNIVKSKTFYYRGDVYSDMHVCLGNVAYPIDFTGMDLNSRDYDVPVAVKIDIGELDGTGVNPSREMLNYTPRNKKIIKAKMDAVMIETKELLAKQYDNIKTLKDYYSSIENFGRLNFTEDQSIKVGGIKKSDINFENFKYKGLLMPKYDELINLVYNHKLYGKKYMKKEYNRYRINLTSIADFNNIFYTKKEFNRVVLKQSYLQHTFERFHLHIPKIIDDELLNELHNKLNLFKTNFVTNKNGEILKDEKGEILKKITYNLPKKKGEKLVLDFIKDIQSMVEESAHDYDKVIVRKEFISFRKEKRLNSIVLNEKINIKILGSWDVKNYKLSIKKLNNFKGKIYYGFRDDQHQLRSYLNIFSNISGYDSLCTSYNQYDIKSFRGTMFISISKGNEKYLKMLGKKAIKSNYFYQTYISRKLDFIIKNKTLYAKEVIYENKILDIFKNKIFKHIDKEIFDKIKLIKKSLKSIKDYHYNVNSHYVEKLFNVDLNNLNGYYKYDKELEWLVNISELSKDKLQFIYIPNNINVKDKNYQHLIDLVNLCIDK